MKACSARSPSASGRVSAGAPAGPASGGRALVGALALCLLGPGCTDPDRSLAQPASSAEGLCELTARGTANTIGLAVGVLSVALGANAGRCSAREPIQIEGSMWFGDDAAYIERVREHCQDPDVLAPYERMLDRGYVIINDANVEACRGQGRGFRDSVDIQQLVEASQNPDAATQQEGDGVDVTAGACQNLTEGLRGEGETCLYDLECAGSLKCELNISDARLECLEPAERGERCRSGAAPRRCGDGLTCADDRCVEFAERGDVCRSDGAPDCEEGLACADLDDEGVRRCVDYAEEGDDCAGLSCEAGLQCITRDDDDDGDRRCRAPGDEGDWCDSGRVCGVGLYCDEDERCRTKLADFESCSLDTACEGGCSVCRPDEVGGDELACLDRGIVGDACQSDAHCRYYTYCDIDVCVAGREEGRACERATQCGEGLVCDTRKALPTCETLATVSEPLDDEDAVEVEGCGGDCGLGDVCEYGSDCRDDLICVDRDADDEDETEVCTRPPAAGERCLEGNCEAGAWCDSDTDVEQPTCREKRAPGGACFEDAMCKSSACFVGPSATEVDGRELGECVPAVEGGCLLTKDFFPTLVFFSVFLWIPRLRRRRGGVQR